MTTTPDGAGVRSGGGGPPVVPRSPATSARRLWARAPLRTRLPVLFALLLVVGLTVTGLTAVTLLRQSLVAQLDADLTAAAPRLLREATGGLPPRDQVDGGLPSDYHVVFFTRTGQVASRWSTGDGHGGAPDVPGLSAREVAALDGRAFTVPSTDDLDGSDDGESRWRVLSRPLVTGDGAVIGSMAVALPMTAADATLDRMRSVLVATGAGVVGLGAVAGWWGVRRSLRPLREIEDTAAAIAAGDLSRRIAPAPESTEVGRLGVALNSMLGQLERAFDQRAASERRMRQFVADASHELRTPLATIRGYGELYRMGALSTRQEVDDTVRRMEDSATRMGTLVDDLLQLARLDEGRELRREPVDLLVLAGDAAADLRALDRTRTVRLEPLAPGGTMSGATVPGDEERLRQVLANLVGNVAMHTPAGTPVELALGRVPGGRHVALEVRDHGPGIAAEHAGRAFERFYRADPARSRASGGSGLGLAIVAAIVAAHDGSVELATTPGGGTTVRVALPAAGEA